MSNPRKVKAGSVQVNVKLDEEMVRILRAYADIKGVKTLQDGIRRMITKAKDFVAQSAATPTKPVTNLAAPIAEDPKASDDGMSMPAVSIPPPAAVDLDEDGEEISDSERMRRSRARPAMEPEVPRWASDVRAP